jgi:hypothetical protein
MIISNLTGKVVDPKAMAAYAIEIGARVSGGTNLHTLAKGLIGQYGLTYTTTNDEAVLLEHLFTHLQKGGIAIANVGGNRPGYKGVFSDGGHYVVVAGIAQDGRIVVLDPGYYAGKFNRSGRKGKVTVSGNKCLCSMSVLGQDTANRNPGYYLFAKAGTEKEEDKVVYKTINDVPAWGKPLIQKLVTRKTLVGDGKGNLNITEDMLRILKILEVEGVIR